MADLTLACSILTQGVAEGAFPGAAAVVASPERVLGTCAVGRFTFDPDAALVSARTRYDLASVSKTFTATAAMALVEEGRIGLDDPVQRWLPELRSEDQRHITVRHLLTHQAGVVSRADWHRLYPTADELWQAFYDAPLAFLPGLSTLYTSAGYMLLGRLVERASDQSLDTFLNERFFTPLGMNETGFCPPPEVRLNCAPTEFSPERGRLLQGEVHDENAAVVGGVCGHTGIFATAEDVATFGQMLAGLGTWQGRRILKEATVREMLQIQRPNAWPGWVLGWMHGNPVFGRQLTGAVGHTGFTGTSLLVDLDRSLTIVLLTNRVYPTRQNNRISTVRALFHDAVAAAVTEEG